MELEVPSKIKEIYPFNSNYFELKNKFKIHYLDEGKRDGDTIILLHGNPTWSFFYRNLIKTLSPFYRVIAVDHLGCGFSEKPQNETLYNLENHIKNLNELVAHLAINKYSLVVHDWGGAIGFGHAVNHVDQVESIVAMNTAAFLSKDIPFRIAITKFKLTSRFFIRRLNLFAYPATLFASAKGLKKIIKKGYLLPYGNYKNRIAIHKFVDDIPLAKTDKSYNLLKSIEEKLHELKCPKIFLWGKKDFCFHMGFLKRWRDIYKSTPYKVYENAGHYLLEDEGGEVEKDILKFFQTFKGKR